MARTDEATLGLGDRLGNFEASSFSLSNPELLADPYPYYRKIRSENPIHYCRMYGGSWVLFGYADVRAMLCDSRLTNDRARLPLQAFVPEDRPQFSDMLSVLAPWVAFFDGEPHVVRRRALNDASAALFHRGLVAEIVRDEAEKLMAAWDGRGAVDLVRDFTRPLPALVMARLLGAPQEDHQLLTGWSDDIAYLFGASDLTVSDVRCWTALTRRGPSSSVSRDIEPCCPSTRFITRSRSLNSTCATTGTRCCPTILGLSSGSSRRTCIRTRTTFAATCVRSPTVPGYRSRSTVR
jgi:cytochrome P450